jgi:hypothetical protein
MATEAIVMAMTIHDPIQFEVSDIINALNADGTHELWHQQLNHPHPETLYETQKCVIGIPKLRQADDLEKCDSCIRAKIGEQVRGKYITTEPRYNCQQIQADFGFMAIPNPKPKSQTRQKQGTKPLKSRKPPMASSTPKSDVPQDPKTKIQAFGVDIPQEILDKYITIEGIHGYKSYLIIVDRKSRYIWVFLSKNKEPPLQFLKLWFRQHRVGVRGSQKLKGCVLRTDGGGELAGSHKLQQLCDEINYMLETTGTHASSQNGLSERPHRHAGKVIRVLLDNTMLPPMYWPYALVH